MSSWVRRTEQVEQVLQNSSAIGSFLQWTCDEVAMALQTSLDG
jgi:hypothetical protein